MSHRSTTLASRVGRGLGWSTASNFLLRVGSLLVSIVMARLIAPDQFGIFAVAMTLWSILSSVAEFGLTAELVRSADPERRGPTVATLGLLTGGTLALAMFVSAPLLADAFSSPDSTAVIRLMSVNLLVVGLTVVPAAQLYREIRQAAIFGINGLSLLVSCGVMILLAAGGFGAVSLAWGQIVGQLLTLTGQIIVSKTVPRFGFDREIAKQAAAFCLPLALANLLSWVLLGIDNVIVARVMDPVQLGLYVMAFNVSSWPMTAVGQAVRVVALPAFAELRTAARRNAAIVGVSGPVWAFSLLAGIGLSTLAAPLISVLYGDRWAGSVAPLVGLAAFGALRVVFDLLATFLTAAGASRSVLIVQIWWLIVLIPAMIVGVRFFGLAGAGWAHVAVGVAAVLPAYLIALHRLGVNSMAFIGRWLRPTLFAVPALIACWWIGRVITPPVLALVLGALAGVLLYLLPLGRWLRSEINRIRGVMAAHSQA